MSRIPGRARLHHYLGFSDQEVARSLACRHGRQLHRCFPGDARELEADGRRSSGDDQIRAMTDDMTSIASSARIWCRATAGRLTGSGTALGKIEAPASAPAGLFRPVVVAQRRSDGVGDGGTTRVAIAALLIALAVAAILIVGSQHRLPPPCRPARPGLVVYTGPTTCSR
jgi:hypothetical protein